MKSIKEFTIEDHGMLSVSPEVNEHNFKYMVVERAMTTFMVLIKIFVRVNNMGFGIKILEEPLEAIPRLEPEDGKQHFITVRWS